MSAHLIMLPDFMAGRELRRIVWDDEAGTVDGDHSRVPWMREVLAREMPVSLGGEQGLERVLHDPAHTPSEFLWLLWSAYWPILKEPLRSTLPPIFDGVEPSPMTGELLPDEPGVLY